MGRYAPVMVGRYSAAAVCTPGLELLCSAELADLGCRPKPAGPGTVEFAANARQLYAANVWLRTASRVMVEVGRFRATDFAHLERAVASIDWSPWIRDDIAPKFRVSSNESKLYHTEAVAERLHRQIGAPAQPGQAEQLVIVRIKRNTVTMRVDSSGDALHLRPWRTEIGPAPIRTTMAAAMLRLSDWSADAPLLDPFCGSGTIAIEAALAARGMPVGGQRRYAFQHWADFEPGTWASVAGEIVSRHRSSAGQPIWASDRDSAQILRAKNNAERAGVSDDIDFSTNVVSHLKAQTGNGLVITNPPYGKRVGDGRLDGLYRRFGSQVRERLAGFDLTMVCPDSGLAKRADRNLKSVASFRHGGLRVNVYHRSGQVPSV